MHLDQVDPVGGAAVEVLEVKVKSAFSRPQMPTLAQMGATGRRAVRVQMVSSSHKETQPYKAVGRRLQLPSTLAREPQSRGAIRAMLGRHSLNSLRSEKRMSQI